MTGKSIALGIGIVALPLIARIYTPDDFGIVALFLAIVTIGSIVGGLGYDQAIILPKTDAKAVALMVLAVTIVVAFGLCFALINLLGMFWFDQHLLGERLGIWVWFIPIGALLWILTKSMDSWLLRQKNFTTMGQGEIVQALVTPGSRLLFGTLGGSSVWGLILGYVLALVARIGLQTAAVRASLAPLIAAAAHKATLRDTAREYRDYPLYNTPAGLVRSFAHLMPVMVLGVIYAPGIVGYYAMANRLVQAPLDVLAMSVRRALLQKYSELHNANLSLRRAFLKATLAMAVLGGIPTLILMTVGKEILTIFLSSTWQNAGVFVEILAPLLLSVWIVVPSSAVLIVLRKQHIWLRVQITVVVLQLAVFLTAYHQELQPTTTLAAYVAVIVVTNIGVMVYAASLVWRRETVKNS